MRKVNLAHIFHYGFRPMTRKVDADLTHHFLDLGEDAAFWLSTCAEDIITLPSQCSQESLRHMTAGRVPRANKDHFWFGHIFSLPEPSGNIIFGSFVFGIREDPFRFRKFDH